MTVEIDLNRRAVNLKWDTEKVKGDATIHTTNPETGDVSSHEAGSDGYGVVTVPSDYQGTIDVTVVGADGGEDTGTVTV